MIPQSNISKLANRLLKKNGGKRIPEIVLEKDYCIAWFLVGLSNSPLKKILIFKGGTALKQCHFSEYRFSEDLDFTLASFITFEHLVNSLNALFEEVKKSSNITFKFSRKDKNTHQNSYTLYISYEGPLPSTSITKEIKIDVTINEVLFYPPQELPVIKNYFEFDDLPENATILVYSLNEIASEKLWRYSIAPGPNHATSMISGTLPPKLVALQ